MHFEYHSTMPSTKKLAEHYITNRIHKNNFVIVADCQTEGVGRKGNIWLSPKGGLWFSIGLQHISTQKCFPLYIGFCVLKAINDIIEENLPDYNQINIAAFLKWPNDIFLLNKKICGLICSQHSKFGMTNIGIGINTNLPPHLCGQLSFPPHLCGQPSLPPHLWGGNKGGDISNNIPSILNLLNLNIDNSVYLSTILNNILQQLPDFEHLGLFLFEDYYKKHDYLSNKYINIISGNEEYQGLYKGCDKDGALLLQEKNSNIKTVFSGSVNIQT